LNTVLASSNPGKLAELSQLLAPLGMALISQGALGISGPPEDAPTFVENALLKARHASLKSGLPALADDSGIAVQALKGAPGVRSARFAGDGASDADNNAKLIDALRRLQAEGTPSDTSASFHCVIVYLEHARDPTPLIAAGRWDGRIVFEARGSNGFGYDPHFWVEAENCTAAELSRAVKNTISHRARAVAALLSQLRQ
jgi:XTP/dITP diphosphohydrolase